MLESRTLEERLLAIGKQHGFHYDAEAAEARRVSLALGERDDYCSCVKDEGLYGESGWHWRINPAQPGRKLADVAVERCSRYQAAVEQTRKAGASVTVAEQALLQKAGVPRAYLHCSLESWTGRVHPQVRAFASEAVGNLLLHGSPGCGKTHLATAIARECLKRDIEVVWRSVPEILAGSSKGDFHWVDQQIKALQYADLAILDDVGGERGTEFDLSAVAEIVHYRHAQQWATVATTNLTLERLAERDGRIASRLASGGVVELGGRDRRLAS